MVRPSAVAFFPARASAPATPPGSPARRAGWRGRVGAWALHTLTQGVQEPTHMRRMVFHAIGAANDLRHALAGPDLPAEPIRLGPCFQERGNLRQLLSRESWLPTRRWMAPEPLHAVLAPALEPLAHRPRRHPHCGSDVLLFPALLLQLPGASPPSFAPVELGRLGAPAASVAPL